MRPTIKSINDASKLRHGADGAAEGVINPRIILVSFLISYWPTHVFESMAATEQSLYNAAASFVDKLQRILARLATSRTFESVPFDLTEDFSPILAKYLRCFSDWKIPDTRKLTLRIQHALVAIDSAKACLPSDEPVDSTINVALDNQTVRLREKLRQIAGADVLAQFDANRPAPRNANPSGTGVGRTPDGVISNEQLAHELLLDPCFQLTDAGEVVENPVADGIRRSFHRVRLLLTLFVHYYSAADSIHAGVLGQPVRRSPPRHALLRARYPGALGDPRRYL